MTLPYTVDRQSIAISASLGVAHTDISGHDSESLLAHAGIALDSAREQLPVHAYVLFDETMASRLRERRNIVPALATAHRKGQMTIAYQPQCRLETGALVGVEASIRWLHPELGVVSPDLFLPLAEESGEIVELGRWALRTACAEVAAWPFKTRLALKVSTAQLALVDIVSEVKDALGAASMAPQQLELEVSGTPFLAKSFLVAERLKQLRALGVGITLDDFGAGHASLGDLSRLSIDRVKIAGEFVSRLPQDGEAGAVVRAVMTLAFSLEMVVLADGVETADQAWMLRMMGCREGQGPFFGRPRSGPELIEWYGSRHGDRAAAG
jgi:predicted signal transduction protein with EAL and GGDEF domain